MKNFLEELMKVIAGILAKPAQKPVKSKVDQEEVQVPIKHIYTTPKYGQKGDDVKELQRALNRNGANLTVDGDFGKKTKLAVSAFQKSRGSIGSGKIGPKTMEWLRLKSTAGEDSGSNTDWVDGIFIPGTPVYPRPHRFHPRFDDKLPKPFTHLHPFDVGRSVAGEKEIPGSRHNPFIAHLHEHSGNLGTHSDEADYSDEVPHCASGLNWCADMSGCEKSDSALAASWSDKRRKSYNPRKGDWVEVGDIIHKKTGKQNHVTMCNKRFNRKTDKYYEGFGFNQGNSIKTSTYKTSEIISVQMWKPKAGTHLAPIGFLGTAPVPSTGGGSESTR